MQKLKTKKRKLNKALIKKSFLKIVVLSTIAGLNWTGISAVGNTVSYFSDTEDGTQNIISVGTLDFSVTSESDFSPNITPTQNTSRAININNDGSLGFNYAIKSTNVSGDICSSLNLSADLGGVNKYTGAIDGFDYSAGQFTTVGGGWQFEINLVDTDLALQNENCSFDFIVGGSQIGGVGFSDQEIISNTVNSGTWTITPPPAPDIVINEFLPNPDDADNAPMPGGEWVELYNNSSADFDVSGWVLYDSDDSHELYIVATNTNTGDTIVPGYGWLVVYRNGDGDFILNNNADSVRLFTDEIGDGGALVDSYAYTVEKSEGFSYARIPDGIGTWVDPIPTPGAPNILEEETEEPIIEEPVAEEPVVVEETVPGEEVVPDEVIEEPDQNPSDIETGEEPVPSDEIQVPEEFAMPEEPVIIEQETVIEPESEPVVAPVDDSGDNSEGDSSTSSETTTESSDSGSADSAGTVAE